MKKSLIFDRSGRCKGCEFEFPGPSQVLGSVTMCTWCERNPYLITEIRDCFQKRAPVVSPEIEGVKDDSTPAQNANRKYLREWGVDLSQVSKKKKKKKKPTED